MGIGDVFDDLFGLSSAIARAQIAYPVRHSDNWACEVKERRFIHPYKERWRRLTGGNEYGYWNGSLLIGKSTEYGEVRAVHLFRIPPEQLIALNVRDDTQ